MQSQISGYRQAVTSYPIFERALTGLELYANAHFDLQQAVVSRSNYTGNRQRVFLCSDAILKGPSFPVWNREGPISKFSYRSITVLQILVL